MTKKKTEQPTIQRNIKTIQSLVDKGFIMKVGDGYKLTPLGQAMISNETIASVAGASAKPRIPGVILNELKGAFVQPNKLGGIMQKMQAGGEKLENPEKADLNKDGKLSGYEKKRGKAIEKNMKKDKMNKRYGGKVRIPSNFGL